MKNCDDVMEAGFNSDGVYNILVNGNLAEVYCELNHSGPNWMVS